MMRSSKTNIVPLAFRRKIAVLSGKINRISFLSADFIEFIERTNGQKIEEGVIHIRSAVNGHYNQKRSRDI